MQLLRVGLERRREYVQGKKFLSENYDPDEILAMATFKQRCSLSGLFFIHGLYPTQDIRFNKEVVYQQHPSPLVGSTYEMMLNNMEGDQCMVGPVLQVIPKFDVMMHTLNCKKVHDYLNKDQFDMAKLDSMLRHEFGH
jgi:hypothetical protein